jgi:hypothetical protein
MKEVTKLLKSVKGKKPLVAISLILVAVLGGIGSQAGIVASDFSNPELLISKVVEFVKNSF